MEDQEHSGISACSTTRKLATFYREQRLLRKDTYHTASCTGTTGDPATRYMKGNFLAAPLACEEQGERKDLPQVPIELEPT